MPFHLRTHNFDLSNSHFRSFASSIHYRIAHGKPFIHKFPQSRYISTTIRIFTNLVKAQPSSPTRYSSKPQNYNLIFPLLDDRSLEPLWIRHRIESSPFFDSVSILIKSVFHLPNHFELDRFRLRKALKSILDKYLQLCNFPMVLGEHIYLHTTQNTWTVTEGQCSARAEASVQNPFISRTARPNLRVG